MKLVTHAKLSDKEDFSISREDDGGQGTYPLAQAQPLQPEQDLDMDKCRR